ncbi:MAG: tRNA uridine-5-carboxymethylaminomethyl(34) synthesis GTPase MnmE [Akkermansia sp.]|nr:tRNA uridine-5-carboxymethylaminomethyl(34) synthesis GTPase MnmE [Akkermansia sp.]
MSGTDTIAAIATAPGAAALAVVRVSGPQAAQVVMKACAREKDFEPRRATLVKVRDAQGRVLDECVATVFVAPHSFTGEDVAELCCHGGMLVMRRVLERLLECGARPAEPGEFTRRAFENGRLDLTQAEAVMDVISAGSDLALRAAQNQLQGAIGARVQQAADKLIGIAAHVEAYIDFPEEDIAPDTTAVLVRGLDDISEQLRQLLATADEGRILREGVRTAIIGAPNVGKSSLLNMLLGYDRAIVSPTAGTTRDTIEESVAVGGLRLRLIDTAGLHESADDLERAGMERSRRAQAEADLILEVCDASQPRPQTESVSTTAKSITLLNKSDLPEHADWRGAEGLRISCATGQGRGELEQAIESLFLHDSGERDSLAAINTRHRYALQQALDALSRARASLEAAESPELTDVDLREALDALGSITGRVDTEDILSRVFSTFCLGK